MCADRSYSLLDKIIMVADEAVRTLFAKTPPTRENPATHLANPVLLPSEKKQSGALMRVNHVGEICAQALYLGQSLTARSSSVQHLLREAAREENDHLAWCEERLRELNAHQSYLNPLWYLGALLIGMSAGWLGDKWSLGFVAETENQVENHLNKSMAKLPDSDAKSRLILEQMRQDEVHHGTLAKNSGGVELPYVIKMLMAFSAKVMTTSSHWI